MDAERRSLKTVVIDMKVSKREAYIALHPGRKLVYTYNNMVINTLHIAIPFSVETAVMVAVMK